MTIEDGDGKVLQKVTGTFTVGRPSKALEGQAFRAMIAAQIGMKLGVGTYSVRLAVQEGTISRVAVFNVVEEL